MSDIILTGDNVNEGRIKINSALDALDILWSGDVGNYSIQSISGTSSLSDTDGDYSINFIKGTSDNDVLGDYSHGEGYNNFIWGGSDYSHVQNFDNTIGKLAGDASFSHVGGKSNVVLRPFGFIHTNGNDSQKSLFSSYSSILGGFDGQIGEELGSDNNTSSGILGGYEPKIVQNTYSNLSANTILGGSFNSIEDCSKSSIIGGYGFPRDGEPFGLLDGQNLMYRSNSSAIILGRSQIYDSFGSIIIGGDYYKQSAPLASQNPNKISASTTSSIISSYNSTINRGGISTIIGGDDNNILFSSETPYVFTTLTSGIIGGEENVLGTAFEPLSQPDVLTYNSFAVASKGSTITASRNCIILGSEDCGMTTRPTGNVKNNVIIGTNTSAIVSFSQTIKNNAIIGGVKNNIFLQDIKDTVIMGTGVINSIPSTYGASWQLGWGGASPAVASFANRTIVFDFVNGNGMWDGTATLSPADYAEYFEWNDGNLLNEDRVGYFASLVVEKVEIGNQNIVGIVSSNPALIGNSAELKWNKVYLTDEWGIKIYNTYKKYSLYDNYIYIDEDDKIYADPPNSHNILGTLFIGETNDKVFVEDIKIEKINPDFDINSSYEPRSSRKEWSPIGMLGKLHVRTAEQITGNTISADSNGMAINGNDYHVLENKKSYDGNYGVVKILFK